MEFIGLNDEDKWIIIKTVFNYKKKWFFCKYIQ